MIKQAIIPLAGQGTRLLPLTSVFAKELLPMNGKPGIEYIIEECIDASIHSSIIYSIPGLPFIGKSSLAKTLVSGNNLVPCPANGIIACLII